MQKLFEISVEPHLVKFAVMEFWEDQQSPFRIDEGSLLGKQILLFLIDKRSKEQYTVDDENSTIQIVLSDMLAKHSPDLIKLSRINQFLDDQLKSKLNTWVAAQMATGKNRYQSILAFMKYYDLDAALMIKRYYQYIYRMNNKSYRKFKAQKT